MIGAGDGVGDRALLDALDDALDLAAQALVLLRPDRPAARIGKSIKAGPDNLIHGLAMGGGALGNGPCCGDDPRFALATGFGNDGID